MDGTSSAHSFNPYAYFGHSWSYFDIQNLRLVILYVTMMTNPKDFYIVKYHVINELILEVYINWWLTMILMKIEINLFRLTTKLFIWIHIFIYNLRRTYD